MYVEVGGSRNLLITNSKIKKGRKFWWIEEEY
jgi:hypothetical protein